ncbi:MAG: sel1 repeat family protein [Xanthomonadales bacterium]|nr:sel1 repeat family protein [Gammaproteobacteria bacterium]MBT8072697.1 sel1 repeat family protein [Gammaproteobacteria bacterium]NNK03539.1 sel1 repeat family protein [Xanthomonadales bacterium]
MKQLLLMMTLCLVTGLALADFEIKDPSQPEEMIIEQPAKTKRKPGNKATQLHVETMLVLAEMGVDYAQFQVGTMYDFGHGLAEDPVNATKWYRKAAWQGIKAAQFYLGRMYLHGRGVPKNYDEAFVWLNIASIDYEAPAHERDVAANKLSAVQLQAAQLRSAQLFEEIYAQKMEE